MTDPQTERVLPPAAGDERTLLRAWLDFHRATFARKLEGLRPQQLAMRSCPPSELSLLGLLRHHAEGERYMFAVIFQGEPDVPLFPDNEFAELTEVDEAAVHAAMSAWQQACNRSRAIEAAAGLDQLSAMDGVWHDEPVSMRWLLLHVIEEYARHNGHADLLRERIDGVAGW